MEVVRTIAGMRALGLGFRRQGLRVGLVPTMGCLHEGHLSLVRLARKQADRVVVSLFVNPIQFGPKEDFAAYPRDLARDEALCAGAGVDALFCPEAAEMYRPGHSVYADELSLSRFLCGASRPGHFRGVVTVVAKLFHIVQPDIAVFGEKDAQQWRVLRRMARDLDFPVTMVLGPTVREPDGLAMSSRNRYLDAEERRQALCLRKALDLAEALHAKGCRDAREIVARMKELIGAYPLARMDYVEVVDDEELTPVEGIRGDVLVALAVRVGRTRLIDNTVLRLPAE